MASKPTGETPQPGTAGTRHRPWRSVCRLLCSQRTQTGSPTALGVFIHTRVSAVARHTESEPVLASPTAATMLHGNGLRLVRCAQWDWEAHAQGHISRVHLLSGRDMAGTLHVSLDLGHRGLSECPGPASVPSSAHTSALLTDRPCPQPPSQPHCTFTKSALISRFPE